eukprot:TRINITY_DN92480_c0_g1_i1.p1 TRINITY_DN92480_c0_g1~~TRINITY_DN92480_c0_g1_i1.p1  ORF type:complete len:1101 (-),score=179.29 TRINITY_DN92480_c0_g1_i1:101-3403(-)
MPLNLDGDLYGDAKAPLPSFPEADAGGMMLFPPNRDDGTVCLAASEAFPLPPLLSQTVEGVHEEPSGSTRDRPAATASAKRARRTGPLCVSSDEPPIPSDASDEDSLHHKEISVSVDKGRVLTSEALARQLREVRLQLRGCDSDESELRAEYEAEVQRCAELREELEALEKRGEELEEIRAPCLEELRRKDETVEQVRLDICRGGMCAEDSYVCCDRLLEARNLEIRYLEQRVVELQQKRQRLLNDGPARESALEESVLAADKEMSLLQEAVGKNEKTIHEFNSDVKSVLDFMLRTNLEAAGGPQPELSDEDFLPSEVRSHLKLSQYGQDHLRILIRKYEILASESGEPAVPGASHPAGEDKFEPAEPQSPLQILTDEVDGNDAAMWQDMCADEDVLLDSSARTVLKPSAKLHAADEPFASATAGFEDEASMLLRALQQDAEYLAALLENQSEAPVLDSHQDPHQDAGGTNEEPGRRSLSSRDTKTLLMAAAMGDVGLVQRTLVGGKATASGDAGAGGSILHRLSGTEPLHRGWTVWHMAAFRGREQVLAALKETSYEYKIHYLEALERPTESVGLPPLAIACLGGHVEAVKSLLHGMAPVHAQDARGNSALLWAAASGSAVEALAPFLLEAGADPFHRNRSGQSFAVVCRSLLELYFTAANAFALPSAPRPGRRKHPFPVTKAGGNHDALQQMVDGHTQSHGYGTTANRPADESDTSHITPAEKDAPEPQEDSVQPALVCISTLGAQSLELATTSTGRGSILQRTLGALKGPSRDSVGFMLSQRCQTLARLNAEEQEAGVWSQWIRNYTYGGLAAALRGDCNPGDAARNKQALVLTVERVLLFRGGAGGELELVQVVALSEIAELVTPSLSLSVVIVRMHRLPDLLVDIAPALRGQMLDELQMATQKVAAMWGGVEFGGGARVVCEPEPLAALLTEGRQRAGTLVFLEPELCLLSSFSPQAVLHAGGNPVMFGVLDKWQKSSHGGWQWRQLFFLLREDGQERYLLWCQHPAEESYLGCIKLSDAKQVRPLDTPEGEPCLLVDDQSDVLTLRAASARGRQEWLRNLGATMLTHTAPSGRQPPHPAQERRSIPGSKPWKGR